MVQETQAKRAVEEQRSALEEQLAAGAAEAEALSTQLATAEAVKAALTAELEEAKRRPAVCTDAIRVLCEPICVKQWKKKCCEDLDNKRANGCGWVASEQNIASHNASHNTSHSTSNNHMSQGGRILARSFEPKMARRPAPQDSRPY